MAEENMNAGAGDAGKETGAAAPSWRDSLAPEYKDKFSEHKDINSVFKDLDGLKTIMGGKENYVKRPGEKATPEEVAAFQTEINRLRGVPNDVNGYEIKLPDGEYAEKVDGKLLETFKAMALKHGLPPAAVQEFIDLDAARYNEGKAAWDNEFSVSEAALKKDWGADYDANLAKAVYFTEQHLGKDLVAKYGNDPDFVRGIFALTQKFSEDTIKGSGAGGSGAAPSVESLTKEGQDKMLQRSKLQAVHPDYARLTTEINQIYVKIGEMKTSGKTA